MFTTMSRFVTLHISEEETVYVNLDNVVEMSEADGGGTRLVTNAVQGTYNSGRIDVSPYEIGVTETVGEILSMAGPVP